ncbi:unnamed protein product [Ceutorhynchus assimilis]|uniref:Uncharacterized protein n=1 Tax=Ceutorhynchus assimilis TaxID=467358 RepID=A0A9N9QS23_9CUCU|nr:unnamed protein product [Ceutorhynchus assimilis]
MITWQILFLSIIILAGCTNYSESIPNDGFRTNQLPPTNYFPDRPLPVNPQPYGFSPPQRIIIPVPRFYPVIQKVPVPVIHRVVEKVHVPVPRPYPVPVVQKIVVPIVKKIKIPVPVPQQLPYGVNSLYK